MLKAATWAVKRGMLVSRIVSSMKKAFAFGEVVDLTPCPLSAVRLPATQPSVAERGRNSRRRGRKPSPFGRPPAARP
jgi:hypothetical protein